MGITMPSFNPTMYSNHPIQIPPEFPKILKQYTKAAIRTQPSDLLLWSASYFRCLANGEVPPSKERLEYPPPKAGSGLTTGFLRVLHKQMGHLEVVDLATLKTKWRGICLPLKNLEEILLKGDHHHDQYIRWVDFVVDAAIHLCSKADESKVSATMQVIIEVVAKRSDGAASNLTDKEFIRLLKLVCKKQSVDQSAVEEAEEYLRQAGKRQSGVLTYENLKAHDFPSLDKN